MDDENVPTTLAPDDDNDSSAFFVLGCILLILSIVFIVVFVSFVFLRAYKIQIVFSRDSDAEPLLKKDTEPLLQK